METVTIRELRNQGGAVIDRVQAGERLIVSRDGHPVAELRPLPRRPLDAATLLERWRCLPPADADAWRRDIDSVVDQSL
jgi:prevent-host-death family protein